MRTTVTLDDDVVALIKRQMTHKGISFKEALNDAVRAGSADKPAPAVFKTRVRDLGAPSMNVDRALQVVAELDDDQTLRWQRHGG